MLSCAYLPSLHLHLRNAAERPALKELLALCFKELLESTFGGHLSSTSLFGLVQNTLSRIADS